MFFAGFSWLISDEWFSIVVAAAEIFNQNWIIFRRYTNEFYAFLLVFFFSYELSFFETRFVVFPRYSLKFYSLYTMKNSLAQNANDHTIDTLVVNLGIFFFAHRSGGFLGYFSWFVQTSFVKWIINGLLRYQWEYFFSCFLFFFKLMSRFEWCFAYVCSKFVSLFGFFFSDQFQCCRFKHGISINWFVSIDSSKGP